MLELTPEQMDEMQQHARSSYPEECIGILGAEKDSRRISEVRRMSNACTESRQTRSTIAPLEILKIEREYRQRGLKMVGWYHSHPDHPCRPSGFDLEHAWSSLSCVIVKVDRGEPVEVTSWVLREDRSAFDPEEISVTKSSK